MPFFVIERILRLPQILSSHNLYLATINLQMVKIGNLIFWVMMLMIAGCQSKSKPELEVQIIKQQSLNDFSSASGVVIYDGDTYIVGDDSPYLFKVGNPGMKVQLAGIDTTVNNRVPKSIKADYECMEFFQHKNTDCFLTLSSGSAPIARDTAVLYDVHHQKILAKKNIRDFYKKIKEQANFEKTEEINIEGLAVFTDQIFIFHRGNISGNIVIKTNKQEFLAYLLDETEKMPGLETYFFALPNYEHTSSGFSGATVLSDGSLLFTASLERTDDVISDGEILGSFVGYIPVSGLKDGTYTATLVKDGKNILAKKLEGITVKKSRDTSIIAIAVADNDDGTSDLFELEISFSNK